MKRTVDHYRILACRGDAMRRPGWAWPSPYASYTTCLCLSAACILVMAFLFLGSALPPDAQAQGRQSEAGSFYQRPDSMHGKTVLIPAGTTFEGRIDTTVSSKSRAGQSFSIVLASPLVANGVDVIVPAGAQVLGEVVEAIPASSLPHKKGEPKPVGKLRVQLTGLRMPDGLTYPFIGSVAGETFGTVKRSQANPQLGGGVAFMGSQASFSQAAPQVVNRARGYGSGNRIMQKTAILKDPLYGRDQENQRIRGKQIIRSLVRKGNNLYIYAGSPLTVHLDAPFKFGVPSAPVGTTLFAPTFGQSEQDSRARGGRRFARTENSSNYSGQATNSLPASSDEAASPSQRPNPLPGILPDTSSAFTKQNNTGNLISQPGQPSRPKSEESLPAGSSQPDSQQRDTGSPSTNLPANSNEPVSRPLPNPQSQEDF